MSVLSCAFICPVFQSQNATSLVLSCSFSKLTNGEHMNVHVSLRPGHPGHPTVPFQSNWPQSDKLPKVLTHHCISATNLKSISDLTTLDTPSWQHNLVFYGHKCMLCPCAKFVAYYPLHAWNCSHLCGLT